MRTLLLSCFLLISPGALWAQVDQGVSPVARAGGAAAALLKVGSVAGSSRVMFGGWGGLVFGDRFLVALGGIELPEDVDLPGSGLSTGFDLGMGYGGVLLKYWRDLPNNLVGGAGLMLGAGHAEVRDRLIGTELGADNFLVVEPEASISYKAYRGISLEAAAGYRFISGVEDLPTVTASDMRTFTGTLLLRIGGR